MALVRAAIGAGRRRLVSHCSCLVNGFHADLDKPAWELRERCLSSLTSHHNEIHEFSFRSTSDIRYNSPAGQYGSRRFYAASSDLPSHQSLGMPSLSPTMTQGNIVRWRKKEGDKVSAGDVLCEIETDKATVDMECMEDGYLAKILYPDGAKDIKVGQTIAITVEEEGDIGKFKDFKATEAPAPAAKPAPKKETTSSPPPQPQTAELPKPAPPRPPASGERIFASPNARKFAQDNQISLNDIEGTGPGGRIIRADVERFKVAQPTRAETAARPAEVSTSLDYTDLPNTQIRRVIAQRLLQSKQTIPHYYLTVDVCVDKLLGLRTQLNAKLESDKRKKLSVNDFVLKAAALALKKVPECNSSWMEEFIRQYHNVNISVAVQTDRGLMVPVVKDADKKGLGTISEDVRTLAEKARENALKPSDYEGGTFTVSNLGGPFGIKQFCAIINPPQSCILAVGTTEKRVVPGGKDGEYASATFMSATLSCDHRVVDGAIGAHWLGAFKGYIEDPMTLLL